MAEKRKREEIEEREEDKIQASTFNNPRCCNTNECECGICMEEKPLLELLPCRHYFCRDCIVDTFTDKQQYNCPRCRGLVNEVGCNKQYVNLRTILHPRPQINNDEGTRNPNDPIITEYVNPLIERFNEYYQEFWTWPSIHDDLRQILVNLWEEITPDHAQDQDRRTIISSYENRVQQIVNLLNRSHPGRRRLTCPDRNFIKNELAKFVNYLKGYEVIQQIDLNDQSFCTIMGGSRRRRRRKSRGRKRKSRSRKSRSRRR
jgi:hypothetical protein